MDMDMKLEGTSKATNKGVFIYDFLLFCALAFWDIQKLDGPKSEKLKATFHESFQLLAFEIIELLDLSKANPQKWRKAETNAPKLSKRLKVNGANIDIE
jgi:hypothetical protein